jgi:hypothetical protein
MLSAYHGAGEQIVKVFSAHVNGCPIKFDPELFRYHSGRIAILSWRRGIWEDVVMADATTTTAMSPPYAVRLRMPGNGFDHKLMG